MGPSSVSPLSLTPRRSLGLCGVLVRSRGRLGTPITGLRYIRDAYVRSDGVNLIEGVGADQWLFADRALRRELFSALREGSPPATRASL